MEAKKAPKMVKKMFDAGEFSTVDPETKYRYSLTAKCPVDGEYSSVSRFEKSGHSLGRVPSNARYVRQSLKCPRRR